MAAAASFYSVGCGQRYRVYVLEEGTPPGEVVVEGANPVCSAPTRTAFGVEIRIPKSAYVCISSPELLGWAPRKYVVEGPGGRKPLRLDREIYNHATFKYGKAGCEMVGESFFFLPGGVKTQTGADMDRLFRLHHDCDPSIHPKGGA